MLKYLGKTKRLALISSIAVLLPQAYAETSLDNVEDGNGVISTAEVLPESLLKLSEEKMQTLFPSTTPMAIAEIDVPIVKETPAPIVVKSDSIIGYEQELLDKILAEKKAKQSSQAVKKEIADTQRSASKNAQSSAQSNQDDAELYKLAPGESVIKNNREKSKSTNQQAKSKSVDDIYIDKLEFNQANMLDVSRALADISGLNFVATEEAAKKNVTVFLQNISVKNALEAITKNSGLWYRKDKESGTYRIMSTKEYQQDLVVYREDTTRVFNLLHPNPIIVATAIRDLYGDRVILSMGAEDQTFMPMLSGNGGTVSSQSSTNISSSRRGTSSRNGQSNTNITRQNITFPNGRNNSNRNQDNAIRDDLTPDQLEKLGDTLAARGDVYTLSSDELRGINNREQPIYVTLNREHDLMIVRTSDNSVIKDIEKLIKEMDRPTKQVLLEMKILSLDVGDSYRQSMDLDYMPNSNAVRGPFTNQDRNPLFDEAPINVTNTTTTGSTTTTQTGSYTVGVRNILGLGNFALEGGTFVYQFLSDKIRARIQLLQQNNRINTLSSPILLSSNNKPARVFVGTEQVVTTGFDAIAGAASVAGVGAPAIIPITELRNIGNTLQVMPKVNADKTVTLLIQQDSSTLVRGASTIPIPVGSSIQSFNVDSVRTSNIQGTVQAKDGLTIAIGGLIDSSDSEEEQSIPVIGEFPIIGEFFKRKVQQKSKRELLLLITPHIIESAHDGEDLSRDALEPLTEQVW